VPATGKTGTRGIWCQQPESGGGSRVGASGLWPEHLEQVRVSAAATGMGPQLTGTCLSCLKSKTQL